MDKVSYGMSFVKIDKERRIVSGFATLNNVDRQKDIVTTEGSVRAFKRFRGNVRELHERKAAGKLISFGVEQYFDKISNKIYDGIFVRAYISKGAPDTWEKVMDGTLNGFSIGGDIVDSENTIDDNGNMVRVIKDYELNELSLVDNPANTLANIMSIEKSHEHFSDIAKTIDEKELSEMAEQTNSEPSVASPASAEALQEVVVTGDPMTPIEVAVEALEAVPASPAVVAAVAEEGVAQGTTQDANVIAEAINAIKNILSERDTKIDNTFENIVSQLTELKSSIDTGNVTFTDVKNNLNNVQQELVAVKSTVNEFDKRVEAVEQDTAVRKSGDLGEVAQEEKIEKSIWGGRFLSADLLTKY
jgi:Caudovirus prohead serine protease